MLSRHHSFHLQNKTSKRDAGGRLVIKGLISMTIHINTSEQNPFQSISFWIHNVKKRMEPAELTLFFFNQTYVSQQYRIFVPKAV